MKVDREGITLGDNGLLQVEPDLLPDIFCSQPFSTLYSVNTVPLATGHYGVVRKCIELTTGREYAAKFVKPYLCHQQQPNSANFLPDSLAHEIAILALARDNRCPHIVRLHQVVHSSNQQTVVVLEFARGGDLHAIVDQIGEGSRKPNHEQEAKRWLWQILQALHFLHDLGLAHLDLKPDNVLLYPASPGIKMDENDDAINSDGCWNAKLCDFGLSRAPAADGKPLPVAVGTPDYVSPEVFCGRPISLKTDMWSFGVMTYVLLSGYLPFENAEKKHLEVLKTNGEYQVDFPEHFFPGVSDLAKNFIVGLLKRHPGDRMSVEDCLSHPWFCPSAASGGLFLPIIRWQSNKSCQLEDRKCLTISPEAAKERDDIQCMSPDAAAVAQEKGSQMKTIHKEKPWQGLCSGSVARARAQLASMMMTASPLTPPTITIATADAAGCSTNEQGQAQIKLRIAPFVDAGDFAGGASSSSKDMMAPSAWSPVDQQIDKKSSAASPFFSIGAQKPAGVCRDKIRRLPAAYDRSMNEPTAASAAKFNTMGLARSRSVKDLLAAFECAKSSNK